MSDTHATCQPATGHDAQPTLCIVMPVLNEAATLLEKLEALQALRARGVRTVVVDGGSQDDTLAIAHEAVARGLVDEVLQSARGRASQMNAGAAASPADVLLFLHADTRLPPDADLTITQAVQDCAWGRFDVRIDSPRQTLRMVSFMMNLRSRWTGIATGDQAIFVRRKTFLRVGGFPDQALMEDIALSRRLKACGAPACLRQRVSTSARRWHRHGVWRTIFLMWRLRAAYFFGADPRDLAVRYDYRPR